MSPPYLVCAELDLIFLVVRFLAFLHFYFIIEFLKIKQIGRYFLIFSFVACNCLNQAILFLKNMFLLISLCFFTFLRLNSPYKHTCQAKCCSGRIVYNLHNCSILRSVYHHCLRNSSSFTNCLGFGYN